MLRLLFVWLFFSAPLMAEELSLRGFYTVGVNWVDSDVDWDTYKYISRFDNQANITEYTRLGLNLSAPLTDYWTFYGQVLAQQYDDDASLRADWMFLTYQPNDNISLRLGKIKSNQWYISDYIDVGRAYVWAAPPEEVYKIFPVKSYNGSSLELNHEIGDLKLVTELTVGSFSDTQVEGESTITLASERVYGLILGMEYENYKLRLSYLDLDYSITLNDGEPFLTDPKVFSGALAFNMGDFSFIGEGVAIRVEDEFDQAAYDAATAEVASAYTELQSVNASYQSAIAAESAAISSGDQTAIAQAVATRVSAENSLSSAAESLAAANIRQSFEASEVDGINSFHLTASYRLAEKYVPYFTYARSSATDKSPFFGSQKSFTLGFNYDVNFNTVIKLQAKQFEVLDGTSGFFSQVGFSSTAAAIEENTTGTSYTITVDSVF